jgi:hypothetical protein
MTMYATLLLDTDEWDMVIDASGNIAVAQPPYSLAQDVASAIRTFLGEVYYNTKQGLDYFGQVFGHLPPAALLTQLLSNQALTVPGVVTAQTVISSFTGGDVTGQVQFTDESGETNVVNF